MNRMIAGHKNLVWNIVLAFASMPAYAQTAGMITTVAGNGTPGYSGDNVQATNTGLNAPTDVTFDAAGNFYISDSLNNRVRKVDTTGKITTVVGNGGTGFSGDGAGTSVSIQGNSGVAFDPFGNLLVADTGNNRLRKLDANGNLTTIAGNGQSGFSGDGGPATAASFFCLVRAIADPSGNIYIADQCNHRVRKINTKGIVSTYAGVGSPGFNGDGGPATAALLNNPTALALDAAGNLYVCDQVNHRIRKIDSNGIITTVAGTGTPGYNGDNILATSASLNDPGGIIVDPSGTIFFSDDQNFRVRKFVPGGNISTVAGNGTAGFVDNVPATSGEVNGEFGLGLDGKGNLYIADIVNNRVRKVTGVATASAVPAINTDGTGVINGGSYAPGNVVSGSWVAIKGTGFTNQTMDWSNFDFSKGALPTTLNGVQVLFNGQPGAMWYLIAGSPNQINVQAPANLSGNITVQVLRSGAVSNTFTTTAVPTAPGIFSYTLDGGVTFYPAAAFVASATVTGGTLLGDPAVASTTRKAKAGDKLSLYANSLAPSTPGVVTPTGTVDPVTVTIGSVTFPADFAGLVGPGEFQINITVPNNLPGTGNYPITLNIDGKSSQTGVIFPYTN